MYNKFCKINLKIIPLVLAALVNVHAQKVKVSNPNGGLTQIIIQSRTELLAGTEAGVFSSMDNDDLKSDTNSVNENINKKVNIILGIGYTPFKFTTGIGYFIFENTEMNIQYSSMFSPLSLDIDAFAIGMKFYNYKSATIYSASIGGTFSRKVNPYSLDGFYFEGSLGYIMGKGVGFYFLPSLKMGGIYMSQKKSYWIIGIDLSIGWYIK